MTTSTFDHLVVTQTPTGPQISGFISGETQARLVFARRGEQIELVCVTEDLACAELAVIDSLSTWELVSACLEPYRPGLSSHAAEVGAEPAAEVGTETAEADERPAESDVVSRGALVGAAALR